MIIKPQIYNLKLVIIALTVLLCALGLYSYINYSSLNQYKNFLVDENALIEAELNQLSIDYNALKIDNQLLSDRLDQSKIRIIRILDSVKHITPDIKLLTHYKEQLHAIKRENAKILKLVAQLNKENKLLQGEARLADQALDETILLSKNLKQQNRNLSKLNTNYLNEIDKAKMISVSDIFVEGVKRVTTSGNIKTTTTAKRIKMLNICYTVLENDIATQGKKELYFQVLDPNSNVIAYKGDVTIGGTSLRYSQLDVINYTNNNLQTCVFIELLENETLTKGEYYITVYHDNQLIGSATATFN
ncbi:CCDC113/CCDC96 family coiled-coil domain-containing protein [Olleya marilimosa]|uniref:Chromosome partitioning protein ParA n=1 Tax=Olleya marilimosa TaxID=272164 RepID=A0ABR8LT45_9FLAO|nr:hypothetical protein [Olleya marilimosa]MBD3863357.1 hypothetical protein [Olleya marilimosa]MBD3890835.1 hypothetical protein [Olleya marilimosa]